MKKMFKYLLMAGCMVALSACSNNDEPKAPDADKPTATEGAFVLNQGSYYSQIEGSLTLLDYDKGEAFQNLFQTANGQSLGATPQGAVVYGDKIYIAVYESNVIQVIDRETYKSVKMISLADQEGQSPRALVAKDGKVYVSMFNGYVSRIDAESLVIDKTVKVGPNPEIMAIKGNYLYVPNSDGMNYEVGYGTTASKINLKDFTVEKTFEVGLNPSQFATNGSDLFLLCKGNYADVPSTIYRVDDNDESTKVAEATLYDVKGGKLFYINAPYGAPEFEYSVYDIKSGKVSPMLADKGVASPAGLGVDPINGNIVITSYSMENGWASYSTDGYAKVYDAAGSLLKQYAVGVGPCAIFFNYK